MLGTNESDQQLETIGIYGVDENDPDNELIDRSHLSMEDIDQISILMNTLGRLREVERELFEASAQHMQLNENDMRALHFIMVCHNTGRYATPGAIATHLGISTASTTKLLDRLEKAGHISRQPHPTDRRALHIEVNEETRRAAMEKVGHYQSRRFYSASRLTPDERDIVIRFLKDMTAEIDIRNVDWANDDRS